MVVVFDHVKLPLRQAVTGVIEKLIKGMKIPLSFVPDPVLKFIKPQLGGIYLDTAQ
tara:strand:+ start:104 stop:271 length:168 start_codon:yes stop_codon:yes gene_type:complete